MAKREVIIEVNLENKDAVVRLGQIQAETRRVNESIKLLNSIIDENGKATANQARQLGELTARKKNLSGQARELSNDLSGLTAAGMRFRDKMADATLEAIKQSGILGQLSARSDTLNLKIVNLTKNYQEGNISVTTYNQQMNVLQQELNQTTVRMQGMDAKLDELNKDFKEGRITAEQFKAGVQSINTEVAKASGAFTKGITDLKSYALGFVGVIAVAQGLGRMFSNIINITADFDKAQSRLAGILGTTKDGMAALTQQAQQLGATTAFTAAQVSDAQTELAKLGFDQTEILAATGAVLDLAAAAGTDLPNAATVAASTIRGFGLDASEAQRVTDVMAKSFTTTSLDISKFSTAMATVAPVANSAGVSLERTTALLGQLTDRGLDASTAGTSLRNIFLELSKRGMTWEEAMQQINTATDKNAVALDLFGKRGATAATILAGAAQESDTLTDAFERAAGAAGALAEAQLDNLDGDRLKLQSAWEGFVLSVDKGDGVISKVLRSLTQGTTDWISKLTEAKGVVDTLNAVFNTTQSTVDKAVRDATAAMTEFNDRTSLAAQPIEKLEAEFARLTNQREQFVKQGKVETAQEFDLKLAVMERFIEFRKQQQAASAEAVETTEATSRSLAGLKETLRSLKQEYEELDLDDEDRREEVLRDIATTEAQIAALDLKAGATRRQREEVQKLTEAQKFLLDLEGQMRTDLQDRMGIGTVPTGEFSAIGDMPPEAVQEEEITRILREQIEERDELRNDAAMRDIQRIVDINAERELLMAEYRTGQIASEEEFNARMAVLDQALVEQKRQTIQEVGGAIGALGSVFEQTSAEFKAFATVEALISTYLGVARALSDPTIPNTIARIALSAKVLLTGLAAVTRIQGFYEGGYTSESSSDRAPVGVVHANEWVAPAKMVRSPKYRPIIEQLEAARRGMGGGRSTTQFLTGGFVPRPSAQELQAVEQTAVMRTQDQPIFVRVSEINDVQGRVARVEERSTI